MIDDQLKEQIMRAFAEDMTPVQAVIRFKITFDEVKALYEEYHRSKGGMVVWGDTVREVEALMGWLPGSINSAGALVAAVRSLANEAKTAWKETLEILEPYGWLPVDGQMGAFKYKDTGEIVELKDICPKHLKPHCAACSP